MNAKTGRGLGLDRTSAVIFVDSFVPENGQSGKGLTSPKIRQILDDSLARGEFGRPAPDAEAFRIASASDRDWSPA